MLMAVLTGEASAALIGAGVGAGLGWVLGFLSDFAREALGARRARKIAALLIYGELTSNLAVVSALRKYGVWSTERIHRSAWEAQGAALLYGADMDRVGRLTQAYNALEDVGFLVGEENGRDFTKGSDAEFLDDTLVPLIYGGMREIGPLAGLAAHEVEERIGAADRATRGPTADGS
jgi:hypothetical protein